MDKAADRRKPVTPGAEAGDDSPLDSRQPRGIGQRIAFSVALICYLCAGLCLAAIPIWIGDLGGEHPVIASLGASVVFFVGAGIVLHVIGRANLPDLSLSADRAEGQDRSGG